MSLLKSIITTIVFISASMLNGYGQTKITQDSIPKIDTTYSGALMKFDPPAPLGYVSDFDHILDSSTISLVSQLILAHKNKTTDEIAVVTISNYNPFKDLSGYSQALSNKWGVGTTDKNNGVMIVICNSKRQLRISTGLGMEKRLPDEECQKIINDFILPQFKQGNYSQGLIDGVREIIRQLEIN
jgi:uncharacterized protein